MKFVLAEKPNRSKPNKNAFLAEDDIPCFTNYKIWNNASFAYISKEHPVPTDLLVAISQPVMQEHNM